MLNKKIVAMAFIFSNALLLANPLAQKPVLRDIDLNKDLKGAQNVFLINQALQHRRDLGNIVVHRDGNNFNVFDESQKLQRVESHNLCPALRGMNPETLAKMAASGNYVVVNRNSDGRYALELRPRVKGGGFITGAIFGWGTRVLCYGAIGATAAGGVAVVVGTGGSAAAGLSSLAISGATGGAVGTANIAAGALASSLAANAAAAEVATVATMSLAAEAAAIGATTVAYVEGAAVAAQAFGTALWFLP